LSIVENQGVKIHCAPTAGHAAFRRSAGWEIILGAL
jgi:hypothetical protein